MGTQALAPTTAADTSVTFTLADGQSTHIHTSGLISPERINIEIDQGGAFKAMVLDGSPQQITASNNIRRITGPGTFRVNKPATAAAVGIYRD